jgi:glycosyltransferase involved in cell wall biosynthesis
VPVTANTPVITVVIPTFNRKERLKLALSSVLAETGVPIRVHVLDNHSTDGTDAFLKHEAANDSRISYKRQLTNIGATPNYVDAFSSIATEFFVPLADDDKLLPGFLHAAYSLLLATPEAGAAVFYAHCLNDEGELLHVYPHSDQGTLAGVLTPQQHMRQFMLHGHYHWSAILWRKAALDHIVAPYFHTGLPSDVDFQIQTFARFPVVLSREIGAIFTAHDNQHSRSYSTHDIPSFAKLAARMDKIASPLFGAKEYRELREICLDRYKDSWRKKPARPIEPEKAMTIAALAIARLGDLEVASNLLSDVELSEIKKANSLLGQLVQKTVNLHRELGDIKQAWLEQPISFHKFGFVTRENANKSFKERQSNVFKDEEAILVYAEPMGHMRKQRDDGTYVSCFEVDLLLTKPNGQIMIDQNNFQKPEVSNQKRGHQPVIILSLTLTSAPSGDYVLQYGFRDVESQKTGMIKLPLRIAR